VAVWSSVRFNNLAEDLRIDAEHYRPEYLRQTKVLNSLPHKKLVETARVSDGNHLTIASRFTDVGVRYLRGQDLSDFFISDVDPLYIPETDYTALSRSHMKPGDVLVGIVGTIGSVALVTERHGKLTGSCKLAIVRPHALASEYVAAYLASTPGQNEMQRRIRGAVQMGLILSDIKEIPIPIPSDSQSKLIVGVVRASQMQRANATRHYAEAEALLLSSLGLNKLDLSPSLFYVRHYSDTTTAGRVDAEYFSPRYQRVLNHLRQGGQTIGDVAPLVERKFQAEAGATFSYIEIGNLAGNGEARAEVMDGGDAPSRAQWIVQPGDVISSTVRPIRRLSALISKEQAGHVCSSGFAVLHPTGIEPEVLLVYLRLPIVCEILDLHTTASMYPAIPVEQLLRIPIALPATSVRDRIVDKVRAAFAARREAARLLDEAKSAVERLILKN
jgi:restriction endonuclease S subunit